MPGAHHSCQRSPGPHTRGTGRAWPGLACAAVYKAAPLVVCDSCHSYRRDPRSSTCCAADRDDSTARPSSCAVAAIAVQPATPYPRQERRAGRLHALHSATAPLDALHQHQQRRPARPERSSRSLTRAGASPYPSIVASFITTRAARIQAAAAHRPSNRTVYHRAQPSGLSPEIRVVG
jgi:hypothetical protein